ncbi:MAG TPA: ABC transporter ATP-binding protein [Candidatus Limnocylindrales bacterium]|jgi:ABC-2 type transport system ATP-binding protein|nr:ABC transporter ATP-binding protein [Candidatus Limnocylindrales bacterium]
MSDAVAATEPGPAAPVAALDPAAVDPDRPEAVIRTRRLTKKYGELTAVSKLDLAVYPGEIFGLLGQNGAGKTTTILMLLGLSEPTSGEASVMGLDPAWEPREVKRRVGYLPDAVGFYEDLTGRENLRYTARLNGLRRDEAESAIDEVLEQVGLTDRANDPVEQYSRGMRQRLGIADALVKSPDLLILDEPTTSIDPLGVIEILDLLRKLVDERGLAIMLSSHLLSQVQSVCDRIGIFAAGRLIGVGTVDELARQFGDGTAVIEVGLELPTQADVDRASAALHAIPAVGSVEAGGLGNGTWRVHVQPASAEGRVRQDILVAAVDNGLRLTAIRPIVPSLDEIYRHAVERPRPTTKRTGVKRRGSSRPAGEKRPQGDARPDGDAISDGEARPE